MSRHKQRTIRLRFAEEDLGRMCDDVDRLLTDAGRLGLSAAFGDLLLALDDEISQSAPPADHDEARPVAHVRRRHGKPARPARPRRLLRADAVGRRGRFH